MIYLQKKWIQLSNGEWYLGEEIVEKKGEKEKMKIKKLPDELVVQLDNRKNFNQLSREEKLKEVEWCIEKCYLNLSEYGDEPEERVKFKKNIKQLLKLKSMLN